MIPFRRNTPLERYRVGRIDVWVKRDDLFARWPAPPLGKLRGARILLKRLYRENVRLVGCWDTRISALGQGLTVCARSFPGLKVIVAYPAIRGSALPAPVRIAEELGAEVLPVRAGRISISFAEARRHIEGRGGVLLPFGLDCIESVTAIQREAARLPDEAVRGGTVIVSCGSGVTLAGLIRGLSPRVTRFIGVSSGRSVAMIERCLSKYGAKNLKDFQIVPAKSAYAAELTIGCPFPSHPNYDLKAWDYLQRNIHSFGKPVLFWNVGALTCHQNSR
jgi:Pyridoxal-phosphate dependent enzyme